MLFWGALLVRVLYMTIAHTYRFRAIGDHFAFGWEMGRIGYSLAVGDGYANPFGGHTGPTAWVPPLYPLLIGAVFKVFGVYTAASAWILLALNSFFSAATAVAIYEIAARCYNRKVAIWSAWLWALYPAAMQYAVRWIWDMTLTAMLFTLVLVLALRMRGVGEVPPAQKHPQTTGQWFLFGLLWGLIALSNSTVLLFLPVCGIWILLGAPETVYALRNALCGALLFLACVTPWFWRNWKTFHAFIPMRSNLGVEMWRWNNPDANGIALGAPVQPSVKDPTFIHYSEMGEIAYARWCGRQANAFIKAHPSRFAVLSLKRFYFYWVSMPHPVDSHPLIEGGRELNYCFLSITGLLGLGLSLKRRMPASALFAWAFFLLPLTYYFVNIQSRFRHPLEPLITIFSVYLFQSATSRKTRSIQS
jgi:4-amino-4-deoxy-L-arabinose transferase-like glycosyltransferase